MNIPNTPNAILYGSHNTFTNSAPRPMHQSETVSSSNNGKDKVTISAEGMKVSDTTHQQALEKFRLPSWLTQYYPKPIDLSISSQAVEETRQLFQMHDRFSSDGHISSKEQQALDSYRANNMTANQTMRDNSKFRSEYKNEIAEYVGKLDNYLAAAKEEHGITPRNYYEKVLQAEGDNESLHQTVRKKLLEDSRVLELMEILGIKRTA